MTEVPTGPEVGDSLLKPNVVVKLTPLLAAPFTVTTTLPLVAPLGTGTEMVVSVQLVGVADVPLKLTVLVPCVAPKLVPLMVTPVPPGPEVGERLLMAGVTVKLTPLLAVPPTVTTTLPVPAPAGTGTTILPLFQLVGVAAVPLKVTVLLPCVAPNPVPLRVTEVPTGPEVGDSVPIPRVGVKFTPLLALPPTVTTTLPAVAPLGTGTEMLVLVQFVGVAVVPLKVTVLLPWVPPKFVPAMFTEVPAGPDVGDTLVMAGVTVKLTPLLAMPFTVTTKLPVVAPLGTGILILVPFQLVGVAAVPLKVTVLLPCVEP